MRPAHHAGNLVAGAREPHRQMAADGARAENTDTHEKTRSRMERQFPRPCARAQHRHAVSAAGIGRKGWIARRVLAIVPRNKAKQRNVDVG
jgi:hypothetical protein